MAANVPVLSNEKIFERRAPSLEALRRFLHHRSAQFGLFIFAFLVLIAIFAPEIAPYNPKLPLENVVRRSPPCIHLFGCPANIPQHLMGIDSNNRDLFRALFLARASHLKLAYPLSRLLSSSAG